MNASFCDLGQQNVPCSELFNTFFFNINIQAALKGCQAKAKGKKLILIFASLI